MKIQKDPAHVLQTDFQAGTGNALQACVAAIFHRALNDTPNFVTMPNYEAGIRDFVQPTYTVCKQKLPAAPAQEATATDTDVGKLCILRGKSPRGDFGHVVVGRCGCKNNEFELVWDPHPDSSFLDRSQAYGWYMVFDETA